MRDTVKKWIRVLKTKRFNLFQNVISPTLWEVSWKKSKNYGRRRFNAQDTETAIQQAPIIAGLEQGQTYIKPITLKEAFEMTLNNAKRGKSSRRDWLYNVERFLKWLLVEHPDCIHWHLLTRQIIREYLSNYDDKSDTMKRLSLQPIIQTSRFMSSEYDFKDVTTNLRVGQKLLKKPAMVYLSDVLDFCDYLAKENPRLEVGVALQGLAGLQLQEATRLVWDKVDLQRGLIEISGVVKNEYRNRVIPICSRVREALKRVKELSIKVVTGRIIDLNNTVIKNRCGGAFGENWINYSKEVRAIQKEWNPEVDWKVKDLRNCLMTFATINGLMNNVWEQYIGHAPKGITERHYVPRLAFVSRGEEEQLERQMNIFREQVIKPLEEEIGKNQGEILNNFERMASVQLIN